MTALFDRDLLRGSLDTMVLSILTGRERYGYEIQQELRRASGGRIEIKAGTLYPLLHKLETSGFVAARWDDSTGRDRKWYTITDAGRQRLTVAAREWADYVRCVGGLLGPILGNDTPGAIPEAG